MLDVFTGAWGEAFGEVFLGEAPEAIDPIPGRAVAVQIDPPGARAMQFNVGGAVACQLDPSGARALQI